jgi:hypothetical protein
MKVTEIIRSILDIIDQSEEAAPEQAIVVDFEEECPQELEQIIQLAGFANKPDELYADAAKVTIDAGGGLNGPKHPSDIRADSFSMYPNFQAKPGV